jgi:hypothetical protein
LEKSGKILDPEFLARCASLESDGDDAGSDVLRVRA